MSDSLWPPWTVAHQPSLSITNSQNLLKFTSVESVMPSNHLLLCHPLLPSNFPIIRVFSNESVLLIRWPKYWSFSFSISPSNEYSGLISFKMDWLDFPVVEGTLKSLLQHHSSKASILQHLAFFIVQFLHPYMATGKIIALTRWIFVGKVMSLLFNMLSRLVMGFPCSSVGKESACSAGDWVHPWVGKIPWRRKWQPTLVSLSGKFHGQRSLVGCSPWGCKESGTTEQLTLTYFRLVVAFLPRSKCLLISCVLSPSAVIFEPKK